MGNGDVAMGEAAGSGGGSAGSPAASVDPRVEELDRKIAALQSEVSAIESGQNKSIAETVQRLDGARRAKLDFEQHCVVCQTAEDGENPGEGLVDEPGPVEFAEGGPGLAPEAVEERDSARAEKGRVSRTAPLPRNEAYFALGRAQAEAWYEGELRLARQTLLAPKLEHLRELEDERSLLARDDDAEVKAAFSRKLRSRGERQVAGAWGPLGGGGGKGGGSLGEGVPGGGKLGKKGVGHVFTINMSLDEAEAEADVAAIQRAAEQLAQASARERAGGAPERQAPSRGARRGVSPETNGDRVPSGRASASGGPAGASGAATPENVAAPAAEAAAENAPPAKRPAGGSDEEIFIRDGVLFYHDETYQKGMSVFVDSTTPGSTAAPTRAKGMVSSVNQAEIIVKLTDGTRSRVYLTHLRNGLKRVLQDG